MEKKKSPKKIKKKRFDPFFKIKYVGYCTSQLPNQGISLDDLVRFAKFQLATKANRLLKDPIWNTYTKEEILLEFYAHQFNNSEKLRADFEQQIGSNVGEVGEFLSWANKQMKEERHVIDQSLGSSEEKIKFDPKDVLGD